MTHTQYGNAASIPALPHACNKMEWMQYLSFKLPVVDMHFSLTLSQTGTQTKTCIPSSYAAEDELDAGFKLRRHLNPRKNQLLC